MALSYNLNDDFVSTGATSLGGVALIDSQSTEVAPNTQTNIVSIASTYRSIKTLVNITAIQVFKIMNIRWRN